MGLREKLTRLLADAAFKRRDAALSALAELKSNLATTFLNFALLDESGAASAQQAVRPIMLRLVSNVETCLRMPRVNSRSSFGGAAGRPAVSRALDNRLGSATAGGSRQSRAARDERDGRHARQRRAHAAVYDDFALLAEELQRQTHTNFGYRGMATSVSVATDRAWQYLKDSVVAFEEVKSLRLSSTSVALRYFSYALINVSCVLLAPFWASYCHEENFGSRQAGGVADELGDARAVVAGHTMYVAPGADAGCC